MHESFNVFCFYRHREREREAEVNKPCFIFLKILTHAPSRDGNGDPIPDSPRGIPLLGDGYGTNLVPAGI
jgi:hypothetical protein